MGGRIPIKDPDGSGFPLRSNIGTGIEQGILNYEVDSRLRGNDRGNSPGRTCGMEVCGNGKEGFLRKRAGQAQCEQDEAPKKMDRSLGARVGRLPRRPEGPPRNDKAVGIVVGGLGG